MSRLVVKVGGSVAEASATHVLDLVASGHEVCVVHGAGPQISLEMERAGIEVEFVAGRRVTTSAGLEIVRASLRAVNDALCAGIGERALPLFGDEIGLQATPVPALGLVGDAVPSRPAAVVEALATGRIPVVAPLAEGPLNVNADEASAALAIGLGVDSLLFLTDVDGLILDGEVVDRIDVESASALLDRGELQGGIIPKLGAAVTAARGGVPASIGRTAVESVARLRLARGGQPPVSPLIPPSDTLRLIVGEHGQSPYSPQRGVHRPPVLVPLPFPAKGER